MNLNVAAALILSLLFSTSTESLKAQTSVPIGNIQGIVAADSKANRHRSPFQGQEITIEGVVTQIIYRLQSRGIINYGFLIQNGFDQRDNNPFTSDAVYVDTGASAAVHVKGQAELHTPSVRDKLLLTGRIEERYGETRLEKPVILIIDQPAAQLQGTIEIPVLDPPPNVGEAAIYWERREGMRCRLPAGAVATSPRKVYGDGVEGMAWFVSGQNSLLQRRKAYTNRVFRDPHPMDDLTTQLFDNGNGYRIPMSSLGLKGMTQSSDKLIPSLTTFSFTRSDLEGAVLYEYGNYKFAPSQPFEMGANTLPQENHPPRQPEVSELTVATFNVENLYDDNNDPDDQTDDESDLGNARIRPPFNYLPADEESYKAKLHGLALQIAKALHSPDIVMIQEFEDQDIFTNTIGKREPGADELPDILQDLAREIRSVGGKRYRTAADRDGADARGINCGFLYREDKLGLLKAKENHFLLGKEPVVGQGGASHNRDVENPKAFNGTFKYVAKGREVSQTIAARAPQLAVFYELEDETKEPLYVINNHFKSVPDRYIPQRKAQAAQVATIASAILKANAKARIVVGGDLNTFPRPDDPTPINPTDQLGSLYRLLSNTYAYLLENAPETAYTYVYEGQAQTLDHLFVSRELAQHLTHTAVAHVNADFGDPDLKKGTGFSDHDPVIAYFHLNRKPEGN